VELFFALSEDERDTLIRGEFTHPELMGQDRIEWDNSGADEDALWLAAELADDVAQRHEDADSRYLGYRPFVLPRDVLNGLAYRAVSPAEIAAAAKAAEDSAAAFREQHRRR
jgi:hypothetical protein